jgi:phage shock protein PspC (stress-responsive transcriptional regulator)
VELRTTYTDRAEGFRIATLPVSVVAGVLSGIVAVVGFSVPALSLAVLVWIFSAFCVTWLVAYFWHTLAGPDGVALIHTVLGWLFLFTEQKYRHRGPK